MKKDIDQRLKRIGKNFKMPGFRPGKVPANIVKQQYGEQAHFDALNEALERAFGEAAKPAGIARCGNPRIEPKTTESTTHLEFSAVFEVYPEVKLGDLSGVEIERAVLEVGAAEIDSTMTVLRKQRVRYEPVDRGAAKDDRGRSTSLARRTASRSPVDRPRTIRSCSVPVPCCPTSKMPSMA